MDTSLIDNTLGSTRSGHAPLELAGQLGKTYQPGQWLDRKFIDTSSFSALSGAYERDTIVSGVWHNPSLHYFDMRLADRSEFSVGRFEEASDNMLPMGEILFVPAGRKFYGTGGIKKQRNLFIFLNADPESRESKFLEELITPESLRDCLDLRSDRIKNLLKQIAKELYQPGFASELMLEGLGTTLLAEVIRLFHFKNENITTKGGLSARTMRLINSRIVEGEQPPSLGELASLCQISQRHLMRAFREETGNTIGNHVKQLMMEKAGHLLRHTNQQISLIAEAVGFSNAAAFSTAFRRSTGLSPREFRATYPVRKR